MNPVYSACPFPATLVLHRLGARPGSYSAAVLVLYTPIRFFLDFLRLDAAQNGDVRYGGLTPGQYGSIILFVLGVAIAYRLLTSFAAASRNYSTGKEEEKEK